MAMVNAKSLKWIGVVVAMTTQAGAQTVSLAPATMPQAGVVDERFQSYNVAIECFGATTRCSPGRSRAAGCGVGNLFWALGRHAAWGWSLSAWRT
jgi:hypothetical protein